VLRRRLGPTRRLHLPRLAWWPSIALLSACALFGRPQSSYPLDARAVTRTVNVEALETALESWRLPRKAETLRGLRLLYDIRTPAKPALAVTRSIVRANPRLDSLDALVLATRAIGAARSEGLDYGFFCAILLQESVFDPRALSRAGAVGIAQFTLDTADAVGVDPFDWRDAMRGSAALLGDYLRAYDGVYDDPYAATLAAYNAGPLAVRRYHGVPPYHETREYIGLVYVRWSRIIRDVTGVIPPPL
jgi:soluble lytic murein transglycosylase-like protein